MKFLRSLTGARLVLAASFLTVSFFSALQAQVMSDSNFVHEGVISSGNGMISLDWLPNGAMLVCEKQGRVMLLEPDGAGGYQTPVLFVDIRGQVFTQAESGLLGMVLDPDFETNRYMYLFYTTTSDQRLTRMTVNSGMTGVEGGSEVVLLPGLPRANFIHKGGDIEFHPNQPDYIYIALGDDADLSETGGIPHVQRTDFYVGKMLRVNKADGLGLTTNPFYDGNLDSIASRIWAVGFRNPFRFTFNPNPIHDDVMYSSENGDASDRLSWVRMGSNGSWSIDADARGEFLNPPDGNHRVMTPRPPSQIGVAIADGGPFAPDGPVLYNANWYPDEVGVARWRLTGSDLDQLEAIPMDGGGMFADNVIGVDLEFGPDGALYLTTTGGDASTGGFFQITRIRYIAGSAPNAAFDTNPSPPVGTVPLGVQFTDRSTIDSGSIVAWAWDFGDGTQSTQASPFHTYNAPGRYQVSLQVTSDLDLVDSTQMEVLVYRQLNLSLSGQVFDARQLPASPLAAATELVFLQADGTTPAPVVGGSGADGNVLALNGGGVIDFDVNVSLLESGLVVQAGAPVGDGVQAARIGVADLFTQVPNPVVLNFYLSDTQIAGQIVNSRGEPAATDIGVARGSADNPIDIGGGRDLNPGTPTGSDHRVTADGLGFYHLPIPANRVDADFFFDLAADTLTSRYAPQTRQYRVNGGELQERTFIVGEYGAGNGCDDLGGIGETASVDYDTQIEPLWANNCVGCHNGASQNSAGLNLADDSFNNLVNAPSTLIDGLTLVVPGSLPRSYLFEKINCAEPQSGSRMRPSDAMSLSEQALIRDWIRQLNPIAACEEEFRALLPNWSEQNVLSLVQFLNENCGSTR